MGFLRRFLVVVVGVRWGGMATGGKSFLWKISGRRSGRRHSPCVAKATAVFAQTVTRSVFWSSTKMEVVAMVVVQPLHPAGEMGKGSGGHSILEYGWASSIP